MTQRTPGRHIGRSFSGHPIEDECPCEKAACGLVMTDKIDPSCLQHRVNKTIRQAHTAEECPCRER